MERRCASWAFITRRYLCSRVERHFVIVLDASVLLVGRFKISSRNVVDFVRFNHIIKLITFRIKSSGPNFPTVIHQIHGKEFAITPGIAPSSNFSFVGNLFLKISQNHIQIKISKEPHIFFRVAQLASHRSTECEVKGCLFTSEAMLPFLLSTFRAQKIFFELPPDH